MSFRLNTLELLREIYIDPLRLYQWDFIYLLADAPVRKKEKPRLCWPDEVDNDATFLDLEIGGWYHWIEMDGGNPLRKPGFRYELSCHG